VRYRRTLKLVVIPLALTANQIAFGVITNITSSADTTLSENWPTNNLGAVPFANSGTTQNFTKNRALFKFDVAGAVPPTARITSASLTLEVVRKPQDGYNFADFSLHRVLVDWGEGNKITPTNSPNAGTGSAATTNEATWFYRFAFTSNAWTIPGGAATNDYSPVVSSFQTVYSLGDSPYTWYSTPAMVADVQFWLNNPQSNFGWLLLCQSEASDFTARAFGSRENGNYAPQLAIEYVIPPRIDRVQRNGNHFNLFFTAHPGQSYVIQFRNSFLSGTWQTLATVPPQSDVTPVMVVDPISEPQRFYRLATY
jgi:hypothetical protein